MPQHSTPDPAADLERYVTGPAWRQQTEQVYRDRARALNHELKTASPAMQTEIRQQLAGMEKTREPVAKLGEVMRNDNVDFIPVLKDILVQNRDHIPLPLGRLVGDMVVWRASMLPPSLEKDQGMANSLKTVIDHSRLHLHTGTEGANDSAIEAAGHYIQAFSQRSAKVRAHIEAKTPASGPAAVAWCETLAGFTRQEIGNKLPAVRKTLAKMSETLASIDRPACQVIAVAETHVNDGIYRNLATAGDGIKNAALRYQASKPATTQAKPSTTLKVQAR